jgi:hypothetical protein
MTFRLRMSFMALALLTPIGFTMRGASRLPQVEEGHVSGLTAKITMPSGFTRTVKIEGVGCTASLCSRTAIRGKVEHGSIAKTWFDMIAAIKDTAENEALFVMRDGTQRRLSLLNDFRVLYLAPGEKLDLAKVKSIEFVTP